MCTKVQIVLFQVYKRLSGRVESESCFIFVRGVSALDPTGVSWIEIGAPRPDTPISLVSLGKYDKTSYLKEVYTSWDYFWDHLEFGFFYTIRISAKNKKKY